MFKYKVFLSSFMNLLRKTFDFAYDAFKSSLFSHTRGDPESAHEMFIKFSKYLSKFDLEKMLLDNDSNSLNPGFHISNAAGFNKNAEVSPNFLKYLGFDRVVIGTVTYDSYQGNPRPRMVRFPATGSLVNWMGLPGIGAQRVAERLSAYDHNVPLTINLMATPGKKGGDVLEDLYNTLREFRFNHNVDRIELNISCPNTHSSSGKIDARKEYQKQLADMLEIVLSTSFPEKQTYLKVSPDLDAEGIDEILEVSNDYKVQGFTIANTTTNHNPAFISHSPGKGGASGNAVYESSFRVQRDFNSRIKDNKYRLIACGGINSPERARERISHGAEEIQIFTPLIFKGPKLLREIRTI